MKEKITSITAFIGGIGWLLGAFLALIDGAFDDMEEYLLFLSIVLPAISGVLYILWTKFGKRQMNELEKIEYENALLKKKIEQNELKKSLNEGTLVDAK